MNHLLDWCDGRFDIRSISGIGSRIVCLVQYVLQSLQVFVECKFYILDDFQRSLFIIICKGCESSELFGNDCVGFLSDGFSDVLPLMPITACSASVWNGLKRQSSNPAVFNSLVILLSWIVMAISISRMD